MPKKTNSNFAMQTLLAALILLVPLTFVQAADEAAKPAEKAHKEYNEQGLLDAAYDFCATVQNRHQNSCECEQKLLKQQHRFGAEEREMAFYYFTDKEHYIQEFEARRKADPKWQEDFALRMSNMQALIIAACGA